MKSKAILATTSAATVLVLAEIASAHPGHGASGFAAGVFHPISGIDHILAMTAVGMCAVQIGRRALWMLPLTFLAAMIIGGAIAMGGAAPVPMMEQGIAASVLVLGLLVASGAQLALPITTALVALFAFFHGYAHGSEMQTGLSPINYAIGFVIATAALLAIGMGFGMILKHSQRLALWRLTGGAIAAMGLVLLLT